MQAHRDLIGEEADAKSGAVQYGIVLRRISHSFLVLSTDAIEMLALEFEYDVVTKLDPKALPTPTSSAKSKSAAATSPSTKHSERFEALVHD